MIESLKLNIDGFRAHYLKSGSGTPVVLVHGGASDSQDWTNTMEAFSSDYCLYAPDLLGYGQSDCPRDGYYLTDFSDFILKLIETLDLERPVLVGHSLGARICLEIALHLPEKVSKLVLVDAAGLGRVTRAGNFLMTLFWVLRRLVRRPQPYPKFLAKEGEDYHWLCTDELHNLKVPTLIIWKRHDPYLPVALARQAKELIPDARLVVIPGYGHSPQKQDTDTFIRHVLGFLRGDDGAQPGQQEST